MEQKSYQPKKDRYCKNRGGFSSFLLISCAKCQSTVLLYQKDGIGQLIRMYADRIVAPKKLVDIQKKYEKKADMSGLFCPFCGSLLAIPLVYEPENRLAYQVIRGAIVKTKTGGFFPSE